MLAVRLGAPHCVACSLCHAIETTRELSGSQYDQFVSTHAQIAADAQGHTVCALLADDSHSLITKPQVPKVPKYLGGCAGSAAEPHGRRAASQHLALTAGRRCTLASQSLVLSLHNCPQVIAIHLQSTMMIL